MSETKESEKKSGTPRGVLSNDEKIDVAERLKSEGNELVKAKKYKKAIVKYSQVILFTCLPHVCPSPIPCSLL